jgi:uncharacterized membrane protein
MLNEIDQIGMMLIIFFLPLIIGYIFGMLKLKIIAFMIIIGFLVFGYFSFLNFYIIAVALFLGYCISKYFENEGEKE